METFRTFDNAEQAINYRYEHGTGGWIFVPEQGRVILFPPEMSPSTIFHHPFTKGQCGQLMANA